TVTAAAGNLGSLSLAAGGSYTYSVRSEERRVGAETNSRGATGTHDESLRGSAPDGTQQLSSFNIHGAIDAASSAAPTVPRATEGTQRLVTSTIHAATVAAVSGARTAADVTEDAAAVTVTKSGNELIRGVDTSRVLFRTTVTAAAGNLGSLSLAAGGSYTYSV